jgi:hypothetical protein
VDILSGFCKNQKLSTLLNESQSIVMVRAVNDILFSSESLFIRSNFQSEKEIIDSIIPFLKADTSSPALRLYSIEVIKTLGYKAPHWQNELISIFLSLASITNADLTA